MKLVVYILFFLSSVESGEIISLLSYLFGIEDKTNENAVEFHTLTTKTLNANEKLDIDIIKETPGKIFFIVHGFKVSRKTSWYKELTDVLLNKYPDALVAQVDWRKTAAEFYSIPALKTENIGLRITQKIWDLVVHHGISVERFVLIGHSLGAHVCGWVGRKYANLTGNKLPRIIGLDPAQPAFRKLATNRRLNENDAEVVMVIHTDPKLGFQIPCGTIDFFPNGGGFQPGCLNSTSISFLVNCNHMRSYEYFIQAVRTPHFFMGRRCCSLDECQRGKYEEGDPVSLGDLYTNKTGLFYLKTTLTPPYYEA